jgi:negative regulator of replication initiation
MAFYKIDVDEEVWQYLKKHAEPFEDTPNSVLKRLLFERTERRPENPIKTHTSNDFPVFPSSVPQALSQTLEVIYGVKKLGLSRKQATNLVAKKRGIAPQTVIDKYCRQLDKQAYDIDRLLESSSLEGLRALLLEKFRSNRDVIRDFFQTLAG